MKIAYFVNRYPKVSHSFIRREILALERQGFTIERYALRGWNDATLTNPQDVAERDKTRFVLQGGMWRLALHAVVFALHQPRRFWRGLTTAFALARGGDRTLAHHLVTLAEAAMLADWLRLGGARHLHAHFGTNSAEVAMLVHALGGPPYSFTAHGSVTNSCRQHIGHGGVHSGRDRIFSVQAMDGQTQNARIKVGKDFRKGRSGHLCLRLSIHSLKRTTCQFSDGYSL